MQVPPRDAKRDKLVDARLMAYGFCQLGVYGACTLVLGGSFCCVVCLCGIVYSWGSTVRGVRGVRGCGVVWCGLSVGVRVRVCNFAD